MKLQYQHNGQLILISGDDVELQQAIRELHDREHFVTANLTHEGKQCMLVSTHVDIAKVASSPELLLGKLREHLGDFFEGYGIA